MGWFVTACGSASNDALFHNTTENSCGSTTGCGTPGSGGAGGDQSASGGTSNVGGQSESGGIGGAAGEAATGGAGVAGAGSGGDPGSGGQGGTGGEVGTSGDRGSGGSAVVECPSGKYHAVLTGPYRTSTGTRDVGATVDFNVTGAGVVMGSFAGPGGAKATVAGSMDCSTRKLTATIEDGSYQLLIVTVHFSGTFDGTYDSSGDAFDGTWAMTETGTANSGGMGPWSTH